MSDGLNESELNLLAECGLIFPEMSPDQKVAALVQSIKSRSDSIRELSREYQEPEKYDEPLTLGAYLTELKFELKKINIANSALDDLVNNPANWKI